MSFPSSLSQLLGITSEDYQESRFLAWYERFLEKSPEYLKITLDTVDPFLLNEGEYEGDYANKSENGGGIKSTKEREMHPQGLNHDTKLYGSEWLLQ